MKDLESAIRHCEEVADYDAYGEEQCKCAAEHRQLAEWLRELKVYRESDISLYSDKLWKAAYESGKAEAMGESVLSDTEKLPSAQPEIIRCKDCVHWVNNKSNYNYCEWWDEAPAEEDDFCSWAERKDNDE